MKDEIKREILAAIKAIPKNHVRDLVVKETIRCVLYGFLKKQGYQPVPALGLSRHAWPTGYGPFFRNVVRLEHRLQKALPGEHFYAPSLRIAHAPRFASRRGGLRRHHPE